MAKTSRPCSAASRAVISEPLSVAASTTRTPRDRPGKVGGQGRRAERELGNDGAVGDDGLGQRHVAGRIEAVGAGADDGNGVAVGRQGAPVGGGINAEG